MLKLIVLSIAFGTTEQAICILFVLLSTAGGVERAFVSNIFETIHATAAGATLRGDTIFLRGDTAARRTRKRRRKLGQPPPIFSSLT